MAIKEQNVIALKEVEGTDRMIERASRCCSSGGWSLVKVIKPSQDMRFDVPTVGPTDVKSPEFLVFDPEPPLPNHPLRSAPHCILTPHIGSRTASSLAAMNDVVDDVIAVLRGRKPRYPYRDDLTARQSP